MSTSTLTWGRGAEAPPPASVLGHLLDRPLGDDPSAEALVVVDSGGRTRRWSYADLDDEVRHRATALHRAGVVAGDRVGVVATREAPLVPTVLALLRLGAAYVPIDPKAPDRRWEVVTTESGLTWCTGPAAELDGRAAALGSASPLPWDGSGALAAGSSPVHEEADAAAYVLFTSGSTGTPKGVVVTHGNVVARAASYLALTGGAGRYLLHSSLCFDGAVGGMFSTLARGGCLVLPADDVAADPGRIADVVAAERITHLEPVPSWYAALLDLAEPHDLASVEAVILGGEVLPPALARRHHDLLPGARLFNDYGPTEATVAATVHEVPAGWRGDRVPIGRPHVNTSVYVLDVDGALVPPGEVGQLWIGGPGVAAGYLGRPDDPAFRPDPFAGGRMYATGDLASWNDDGLLELHGRLDRQAKVRGQRVEPGEVEAALGAVDGVGASAVEVDRSTGADRLVAYVTPSAGASPSPAGVSAALAELVPSHLRPDVVVVLDAMPLTAGGKVDRRALPPPPAPTGGAGEAPRGPQESAVAAAFAEVLGLGSPGRDTDFFAVGGHSLGAARVVARLRRSLGVHVTVADLVAAPTPAGLAGRLAGRPAVGSPAAGPVRRPRPAGEPWTVPATPRQESFWFLDHVQGAATGSNLVECVSFPAGTATVALHRGVAALVDRHASLRTALSLDDDRLVQTVAPAGSVRVELADLGSADDGEGVDRLADAFADVPFALDVAPLVRSGVVDTPDGPVLVLVVHHAVADGWSLTLLVEDLVALVAGGDAAAALPEPGLEYADLAEWLHERLDGDDPTTAGALEHWLSRLRDDGGAAGDLLPYDHPPMAAPDLTGGLVVRRVDGATIAGLEAIARRTGGTLYHALVASLGAALHLGSGLERFLLGGPLAGRSEPELDRVVGCCINTGLFRVDLEGDPSFEELVGRVGAEAALDEPHQWLPTEVPLRLLGNAVEGEAVTVLLNLLNVPQPQLEAGGVRATHRTRPCTMAYTDLDLYLERDGDHYRIDAVFARARFEAPTIERLVRRWCHLLEVVLLDPTTRVSELPAVDPAEAALMARLEGDVGPAPDRTLLDLVEPHLHERPAHPALIEGDAVRPWSWLDERAGVLAAHLTAAGIGRGDHVVVAVDGVADAVAVLLACWRLAAVPVPVGDRQPAERVAAVVGATAARFVVDAAWLAARPADPVSGPTGTRPSAADPAYVLFTSGSTGVPKGVVVSHGALAASTEARLAAYPERPAVALVAHDLSFDASLGIVAWYLATGGTLVLAGHDDRLDPDRLGALIDRHGVGQLDIVPSHYRLLLDCVAPTRLRTLELVTLGGEACHPSTVAAHQAAVPWASLVNEYGPTESTVWALAHVCGPDDVDRARVAIGTPVRGVVARVADPAGRPVPIGSTGELWLGGHLLAEGYLGDPATTAERFVAHDGLRWYRTGDLARWTDDHEVEFLGRDDDQVKIRGFRIEPGEVEAVLTELDDVVAAAVAPVELTAGAPVLVTWVQPVPGTSPEPAVVRQHCMERLPDWLVPTVVMVVDDLPRTAAGKVDRERLPAPPVGAATASLALPTTELEKHVAEVWRELLGHPVGIDQDFFVIGGQSLLAARMVARLRRELDVALELRDVVATPRVADIARLVEAARADGAAADTPVTPAIAELSREEAAALLDRLDDLGDDEVDALLARLEADV